VSRIGRMPITLPAGVTVAQEGNRVTIQGPRGALTREFDPAMQIAVEDGQVRVQRPNDARHNRALHGLTRALLANMVTGVSEGFRKRLIISGVGYRAEQQGRNVVLQVGFSHSVPVAPPEGISLTAESGGRTLLVEGSDKELVGEIAARIRAVRKPEPYQGKGIAYEGETIRRKAGKAGGR
jgi:large subunit ribosomal protein L6